MSELITTNKQEGLRWQLLASVSAASLLIAASAVENAAIAQNGDRPTVWIELGGQLEALSGKEDAYAPAFTIRNLDTPLNAVSPTTAQTPPHYAFGGEGKISFEPKGSDWVFAAAIRYGRSNGKNGLHQQTYTTRVEQTVKYAQNHGLGHFPVTRFNDTKVRYSEAHAIVDFATGKDVGLGLFGKSGTSIVDLGVRIAQFHTHSNVNFRSYPDPQFPLQFFFTSNTKRRHHSYYAMGDFTRSFVGVGPSISWDASAPVLGSSDGGEVTLDWGVNAAALFGRQKVRGSHETTARYFMGRKTTHYVHALPIDRSQSVISPNLGGFAGVSVRYPNAKFSLGYRADFFFNAMDEGIDARKSGTQGFHGPFVTFAVGLGG